MSGNIDKAEYLKALNEQRESLIRGIEDLELRIEVIDNDIRKNTPPPDVSKMTPLQRAMYEDGQRVARQVAQKLAESSPFLNILEGHEFCKK